MSGDQLALKTKNAVKGDINSITRIIPYKNEQPKTNKLVVTEDEYTDMLRIVIEKEFFPDLFKLKNRVKQNRVIRLSDGQNVEIDLDQLSVWEFQAVLTSEDNIAFEELVRVEKQRLALEQSWMEAAALTHNNSNEAKRLAIEQNKPVDGLIFSDTIPRNNFMFPAQDRNLYSIKGGMSAVPGSDPTTVIGIHGTERQMTTQERDGLKAKKALESLHDDVIALEVNHKVDNNSNKRRIFPANTRIAHTTETGLLIDLAHKRARVSEPPQPTGFYIPDAPSKEMIAQKLRESVIRRETVQKREIALTPGILKAALTNPPMTPRTPFTPFTPLNRRSGIEILKKYRNSKRTPTSLP